MSIVHPKATLDLITYKDEQFMMLFMNFD